MRNGSYFFLLLGLIFAIFSCTKQVNTIKNRPLPVMLVPGVQDTSEIEKGIDAIPEGDKIRIEWKASPEIEVRDYRIYRSVEREKSYLFISELSIPDTTFEDEAIVGQRYYYYIQAVTDENIESFPSDTLDYKLIHKAVNITPKGTTIYPQPELSWKDPNIPTEAYYVIRFVKATSGEIMWISVVPSSYSGDREGVIFNSDGFASIDFLQPGIDYQWRVDIIGSESHSGSESGWLPIRLQ